LCAGKSEIGENAKGAKCVKPHIRYEPTKWDKTMQNIPKQEETDIIIQGRILKI
jgi:hypothetical protein